MKNKEWRSGFYRF